MKKAFLFLFFFVTIVSNLSAQDYEVEEDYISEFIYGINLNTNGGLIGGLMLKSTKIIKPKVYRSLGLTIVGIKNPQETRFQSPATGNTFILAKSNYFYSIRPQYGRDFILFRKAPEEGVQVSATFSGGPSLGLLIPYHIWYEDETTREAHSEQFDPNVHTELFNILGSAGLFDGIGNMQAILGVNVKAGLSLDFSPFRNTITGLEAGFTLEAFTKEAKILTAFPGAAQVAPIRNTNIFGAAYLTFYFGSRR